MRRRTIGATRTAPVAVEVAHSAAAGVANAAPRRAVQDIVGAQKALDSYESMYAIFSDTRESRFVRELLKACDAHDVDAYTRVVAEWDSVSRLDKWMTDVLLSIKRSVSSADADLT